MTRRYHALLGVAGALVIAAGAPSVLLAQQTDSAVKTGHQPSRKAKEAFDKAADQLKAKDTTAAVASLKRAIEADPDYRAAHEQFVKVTDDRMIVRDDSNYARTQALATDALLAQYAEWSKRFPKSAGVQFGIGSALTDAEDPRAKPYLLKAVALDPTIAEAYGDLSSDAQRWGDDAQARDYQRKASAAEPTNPNYTFYHAMDVEYTDPPHWADTIRALAKRFPTSERGAQGLFWLGERSESDSEKAAVFEELRTQFPPAKFNWSENGMEGLFDVYERMAPDKALPLAQDMLRTIANAGDQKTWAADVVFAQNLAMARDLVREHKDAAASAVLEATQISRYSGNAEMFALLRAQAADAAGKTKMAFDTLVARFAKTPSDSVHAAILRYATKLQKSPAQADSAVWAVRAKGATPAPAFKLATYPVSKDSMSLADYKGKVVLLTFWFPGCGPCRGEFPHFQKVVGSFQGRPVAYVGINVERDQDPYVAPFMQGTRYTFTPLAESGTATTNAYHVRGEPTNFLIDQQGRIVFTDFSITNAKSERMLTLMIQSMLDHPAPEAARGR
jgi:thiol-disulfide isomerase/thioredoxin